MKKKESKAVVSSLIFYPAYAVYPVYFLLLSLFMLTGCGGGQDKLMDELQRVASWAATARRTGEAWLGASVPTPYARRTLQTARQMLEEEVETISKSAEGQTEQGAKVLEQTRALIQPVAQLEESAAREDRALAAQQLGQISSQEQAVGALKQSMGAPH